MNVYETPIIKLIEFYSEGVLCNSNETLEENEGIW